MPLEKGRAEHAGCLLEKFETNPRMIECAVFQDESDFQLQVPINSQIIVFILRVKRKMFPIKIFLIKLIDNLLK